MASNFQDNSAQVLAELERKKDVILERIGMKVEGYAKKLCPTGTPERTHIEGYQSNGLKNSITHRVEGDEAVIGTNKDYAPYVELGTGKFFEPAPEWEFYTTKRGKHGGLAWLWFDENGKGHFTEGMTPRHFLRDAVQDHMEEYKEIIEKELKK